MNHTETTLQNNPNNYTDHEDMRTVIDVVLDCMVHTFGNNGPALLDACSLSDIIILRNEFRNLTRTEPDIRHLFMQHGMSLV